MCPEGLDIGTRIAYLRTLTPGWLENTGDVPTPAEFDWLESLFKELALAPKDWPALYPTPEGDILAEWHRAGLAIMRIDMTARSAIYAYDNDKEAVLLNLGLPEDIQRLRQLITMVQDAQEQPDA